MENPRGKYSKSEPAFLDLTMQNPYIEYFEYKTKNFLINSGKRFSSAFNYTCNTIKKNSLELHNLFKKEVKETKSNIKYQI